MHRLLVRAGKISSDLCSKCRSTGAQPARLYGLAKVHKQKTSLRPVLSLPGSCYENLTNQLSKWCDKIEEAKIETSTINIKRDLMEVILEEDEVIVSLDVKSLYTNVPVLESIELAADILYNSEELPPVYKEIFKDIIRMAVTDVYFMCDGRWYIQTDGVAMGSSLAVILANIWMKSFEERISRQPPDNFNNNGSQDSYPCGTCMLEVLDEGFSICYDDCDQWFYLKCTNLTIRQLKGMDDNYWICGCGAVSSRPKAKIFGRYVDDILRSVKVAEIDRLLSYVNTLHPNLEFTIEL